MSLSCSSLIRAGTARVNNDHTYFTRHPHVYPQVELDGCIVWNAHNTVLGEEALLIHIVPVGYAA